MLTQFTILPALWPLQRRSWPFSGQAHPSMAVELRQMREILGFPPPILPPGRPQDSWQSQQLLLHQLRLK